MRSLAEETAPRILSSLKDGWPDQAEYQRVNGERFRLGLAARWKQPFALLGMLVTIAREFGENVISETRDKSAGRENLIDVVIRLHVRACQVTEEIRVLLAAGFADGAMARWRTLHEIAVAAMFIQQHGEVVAERYVLHQIVESRDALRVLVGREESLGEDPVDPNELAALNQRVAELVSRLGPPFETTYGWAAGALDNTRPSFADIERGTNVGHWRPYYKLASHNVHSNPKGLFFKLGLVDKSGSILLAGASNFGLSLPGQSAAISLLQVCAAVNQLHPGMDGIVLIRVMQLLCTEIAESFSSVQGQIADEEDARAKD